MREIFTNLVLFICLAIVFSAAQGCSGTTANSGGNAAMEPPRIGGPASNGGNSIYPMLPAAVADVEMEMLDGTKTKISAKRGKALILNLWAIWCGPCRDEMPHLAKMQRQYGSDRLEVISLNIGDHAGNPEPIPNIQKFAVDMKIDYTLARIPLAAATAFFQLSKNTPIPQTVMVDREGRYHGVFIGGGQKNFDSMQQTLDKMMAEQ